MREIARGQDNGDESRERQFELNEHIVDFLQEVLGDDIDLAGDPEEIFRFAHYLIESYVTDYKGISPKWRESRRRRADLGHRYIDGDPLDDAHAAGEIVKLQLDVLWADLRDKIHPEAG